MNPTNALGLKVVALTGTLMVLLGGVFFTGKYFLTRDAAPAPLAQGPESTERTDADGDKLPDQFEGLYKTDQNNADTDGDGVSDYTEISQGRDPAVAGSQDVSRPVTGSAVADLTTFTQRYLATLPVEVSRDEILNQTKLEAFVSANKGVLVPPRPAAAIKTTPGAGRAAVEQYLHQISTAHNPALQSVSNENIQQAFAQQQQGQAQPLLDIIGQLEKNIATLQAVATPEETAELHAKLLAATEALLGNTRLLVNMPQDFVGGLIGSKNIEELGPVFQQIASDVQALETKYGLE